jgi:hypothetical protein
MKIFMGLPLTLVLSPAGRGWERGAAGMYQLLFRFYWKSKIILSTKAEQ